MASVARSALLRQTTAFASPASRLSVQSRPSVLLAQVSRSAGIRQQLRENGARVAAFHASSRKNLLPPGPQVIEGSVNDPAPIPPPSPSHGSYHWTFERVLAAGLVPLTVTPFAVGSLNPTTDAILMATLLIHSHLGFQSIVVDYIPKRRFPGWHRVFLWSVNAATALVGLGLYEFETNDVGFTEFIKRLWHA